MSDRPLESQGWFYPHLNRANTESRLTEHGSDGSFLVRECENPRGVYVMSYKKSGFIFHSKIDVVDNKFSIAGGRRFESVSKLVEFYTKNDGILTTDTGAVVNIQYPYYDMDRSQIRWNYGPISEEDAAQRLTDAAEEYNFLVRESSSRPGFLALVVKNGERIVNFEIICTKDNKYNFNNSLYGSLPEVIEKCYNEPLVCASGDIAKLRKPLSRSGSSMKSPRNKEGRHSITESRPEPTSVTNSQPDTGENGAMGSVVVRRQSNCSITERKGSIGSEGSLDNEPLYQVYHRNVVTRNVVNQARASTDDPRNGEGSRNSGDSDDTPLLDEASLKRHVSNILRQSRINMNPGDMGGARQSCLFDVLKHGMGQLNLWQHIPEVQRSGVLTSMDTRQKRLQECLFEIMTSEASYLKSLNVLIDHYHNAPVFRVDSDQPVITKQNQRFVFSNIKKVMEVSKGLLQQLRALKKKSYVLDPAEMGTLLKDYAEKNFEVYVIYAKNQAFQERALVELREKNPRFSQDIRALQKDPKSQNLPFQSFLLLPVQRITRMPLLLDSAVSTLDESQPGYEELKNCFHVMQKIVIKCNQEAKQLADIEQVMKISEMLDFREAKKVPLVSQHRHLVKEGDVTNFGPHLLSGPDHKPSPLYMFLFNDMLVITKRKGPGSYEVVESVSRTGVDVEVLSEDDVTEHAPQGIPPGFQHLFLVHLKEKDVKCLFSCQSMSDQLRWEEALSPQDKPAPTVKIFSAKDCPQAQALQPYTAGQPDELSLEESDVVNVTMKVGDGWWQGQRIRDGVKGWFPSSVVVEIQSAHMREKNRRQQYRLMFSTYNRLSNEFIC